MRDMLSCTLMTFSSSLKTLPSWNTLPTKSCPTWKSMTSISSQRNVSLPKHPLCHDPSHGGSYMVEGRLLIRIGLHPCVVSEDLSHNIASWLSHVLSHMFLCCVSCVPLSLPLPAYYLIA